MKAIDFKDDLNQFLSRYRYQPGLTQKLDQLQDIYISQEVLNEIILWKTNRYVSATEETLKAVDELKDLKRGEHRKAEESLKFLLNISGIDLPLASTILRFRNPKVFQIIDRHAYRAITGQRYPLYLKVAN